MAGSAQNHLEAAILHHIVGISSYTPSASVYVGLGTAAPSETDETSWPDELSGDGYQRQKVTFHEADSYDCSSMVRNEHPVIFARATADWQGIRYVGIFTAQTGGELLCWVEYAEAAEGAPPVLVPKGTHLVIWDGDLEVKLGAHDEMVDFPNLPRWSDYTREGVLNLVLRNGSFPSPSATYLALLETEPSCSDSGSDLDEIEGGGYARALTTWNSAVQYGTTSYTMVKCTRTPFPDPTGEWDHPPLFFAVTDASSGGNLIAWMDLITSLADPPDVGDDVDAEEVKIVLH